MARAGPRRMMKAMSTQRFAQRRDNSVDDHIVLFHDAAWSDYKRLLQLRGERHVPRLAFSRGVLELMSPSRQHEAVKSLIGRLVEVWCAARGIEFDIYGSWTLEREDDQRAVEPAECYVFGGEQEPARPHLAVEVVWTSRRLDKLEIYRALGVRELWIWREGRISVHALRADAYEEIATSEVLPGIDLVELTSFLDRPTMSRAIRDYRAAVEMRFQAR